MKKIFLLLCVLIVVGACAPPTNTSVTTNRSEPVAAAPLTEADAIAKEKAVWETLRTKNYDAFANMLATDYVEVGSDGVFDKAGISSYVRDLDLTDVTFADWRLIPIDSDAALITYSVTMKGKYKGQDFPPGPYRATGGWVNRDGRWQSIYYQQTQVKPAPATPVTSPAASPAATAASSPATTPATTPTDPVARERAVWDALKRRDYDAFASYLDPAQVEVESDGVYDKAGTLRGVRSFDASTGELSEFKTAKFDTDAELVTYLITAPGAPNHRATTVWANRGGKWVAVFHQGTEVMPATGSPSPTTSLSPSATAK